MEFARGRPLLFFENGNFCTVRAVQRFGATVAYRQATGRVSPSPPPPTPQPSPKEKDAYYAGRSSALRLLLRDNLLDMYISPSAAFTSTLLLPRF